MRPLDREAVFANLGRTAIPERLDTAQQEQVFLLSEGHPLALTYLLSRLSGATSTTAVEAILSGEDRFTGRIETQYYAYWRSIGSDDDLKQLFGLLARVRGGIDLRWVDSWASDVVVDRLHQSAGHYFRAEGDRRYFLHNSFRLFLEARTAERPSVGYDEERNRRQHRSIAQHCATARAPEWAVGRAIRMKGRTSSRSKRGIPMVEPAWDGERGHGAGVGVGMVGGVGLPPTGRHPSK